MLPNPYPDPNHPLPRPIIMGGGAMMVCTVLSGGGGPCHRGRRHP